MKDKGEASKLVMSFYMMTKPQFSVGVKIIRSDNISEFTSAPMRKFYRNQGIIQQTNCSDTP